MKSTWRTVFEAAVIGGGIAVGVAGCGDDGGDTTADAGCPGCPGTADAGCPGCPGTADAGCPGCPGTADAGCPGCPGAAALPSDPDEWSAWLATDAFMGSGWHCDAAPQPPLPDGPHGNNTICVNDALWNARAGSGDWPVGSAAVKVTGSNRYVDARLRADTGAAGWYFYVDGAGGPRGYGDESAVAFCADCHDDMGARDYVRRIPEE